MANGDTVQVDTPNVEDGVDPTFLDATVPAATQTAETPTDDVAITTSSDAQKWTDELPEDIRGEFGNFESVKDLATEFINQRKQIPSVPEKFEDYQIPEDSPEHVKKFAHETGLSQEQLNRVIAYDKARFKMQQDDFVKTQDASLKELKNGEWKGKFTESVKLAEQVVHQFDSDGEMLKLLKSVQANREPVVLKFLKTIGDMLKEHGHLDSGEIPTKQAVKSAAKTLYPDMK